MEPRPANVVGWMALVLVAALGGFIALSAEWEAIVRHVLEPVYESGAPVITWAGTAPPQPDVVRLKAGLALMADVFWVLPVALLAVIVCSVPGPARRIGWAIGAATAAAFVAGVLFTRLVLLEPLQNSGRVIDLVAYVLDIRPAQYSLFFAGTLLVGGIAFVLPAVYALARMRSPAAARVVAACGVAILTVILGAVVMPGFGLSPLFGQLVILALAFVAVVAVERLGRIAVSDS